MTKEQFKKIRLSKKLYQHELADILGVTAITVRFYEHGRRNISRPVINLMRMIKNGTLPQE